MSKEIEKIEDLIRFHSEELQRLTRARNDYLRAAAELAEAIKTDSIRDLRKDKPAGKTIKEHVLDILEENRAGLHWREILKMLRIRYSPELVRTSLSPQLSRLKYEGKIYSERGIWRLTEPSLSLQQETLPSINKTSTGRKEDRE